MTCRWPARRPSRCVRLLAAAPVLALTLAGCSAARGAPPSAATRAPDISTSHSAAASVAASPPSTSVPPLPASVAVSPSSSADAVLDWRRVPHLATPRRWPMGGGEFYGRAVTPAPGGGFVQVASTGGKTMGVSASPDGATWTSLGSLSGRDVAGPRVLLWDGSRYLLYGVDGEAAHAGYGVPAVWSSPDGRRWTERKANGLEAGTLATVIHAASGYVAVEWAMSERTLWFSRDGVDWTAAPGWEIDRRAYDAVATSGGFLVGGMDAGGAAIWSSSDGATWTERRLPPVAHDLSSAVESIAEGPAGFLALGRRTVGTDDRGDAIEAASAWTSADGSTWAFADAPALDGLSVSLVRVGGTFAGVAVDLQGPTDAAWLVSTADGRSWTKASIPLLEGESASAVETDGRHAFIDLGDANLVH